MGRMARPKRLDALAQIVQATTDPEGQCDLGAVLGQYTALLRSTPSLLDPEAQAQADLRAFDKARRPRATAVQGSLFDPDAWLVIGEGQRVLMGRATRHHCLAAQAVRTASHLAEVTDFAHDLAYWNRRIAAFSNDTEELEPLERRVFGYSG